MNKRIEQLAHEALMMSMVHGVVYRPVGYANSVSKEFADRFAELIIQECLECVRSVVREETSDLSWTACSQVQTHIKEQFGIRND